MLRTAVGLVHSSVIFSRRATVLGDMICELLPHGATVLDVGCGDGTIAKLWKEKRPDVSVEGIDVLVRSKTKIPVRPFDGHTIPYSDGSHDVVCFVDVLHHTDNAAHLITEASRVSKKWIIIKDHYAKSRLDHTILRAMDWIGNAPYGVALPYNYWSPECWKRAFKMARLVEVTTETKVPLYAFPLDLVFGRNLHFISLLSKVKD